MSDCGSPMGLPVLYRCGHPLTRQCERVAQEPWCVDPVRQWWRSDLQPCEAWQDQEADVSDNAYLSAPVVFGAVAPGTGYTVPATHTGYYTGPYTSVTFVAPDTRERCRHGFALDDGCLTCGLPALTEELTAIRVRNKALESQDKLTGEIIRGYERELDKLAAKTAALSFTEEQADRAVAAIMSWYRDHPTDRHELVLERTARKLWEHIVSEIQT